MRGASAGTAAVRRLAVVAALSLAVGACVGGPAARWEVTPSPAPETPALPTAVPTPAPTAAPTTPPEPAVVRELLAEEGKGSWLSGRFSTDNSWRIEWAHAAKRLFTLILVPTGDDVFGEQIVSHAGPSSGSQPMYKPGQYRLRVYAAAGWSVRVVDLDHGPRVLLPATASGDAPTNTPLFEPVGAWVIEWQSTADEFALELVTADLTDAWTITAARSTRAGCAMPPAAGVLYLHVIADGAWRVSIHPRTGELVCPVA